MTVPGSTAPDTAALLDLTQEFLPATRSVDGLRVLTGGASRETWSYAAHTGSGPHPLVLRRDPGDAGPDPGWEGLQLDRGREFAVLVAAHEGGVTVARPWTSFDRRAGLGSGLVVDLVAGTADPRTVLAGPDPGGLLAELGAQLAAVHAVDPTRLPLPPASGEPVETEWRARLDRLPGRHPVLELALVWLSRHRPAPGPAALLHGDFRVGNLLVADGRLTAVLDWEGAHLGDPVEDLGWLCAPAWQFGRPDRPAGGLGTVADVLVAYRAAGGAELDPADVRWWQVLATLRWAVMCHLMGELHRSGSRPSLELAAVGRRAVESEYDLLELMEAGP